MDHFEGMNGRTTRTCMKCREDNYIAVKKRSKKAMANEHKVRRNQARRLKEAGKSNTEIMQMMKVDYPMLRFMLVSDDLPDSLTKVPVGFDK